MICRLKPSLIWLSLLLPLGCAPEDKRDILAFRHHEVMRVGHNRAFADGFVDGCATGRSELVPADHYTARQNVQRYETSADYRNGFHYGRRQCSEEALGLTPEKVRGYF